MLDLRWLIISRKKKLVESASVSNAIIGVFAANSSTVIETNYATLWVLGFGALGPVVSVIAAGLKAACIAAGSVFSVL